ncbi:MAG: histidine--tRNA ligase [Oscillospiraceae bacterium]|nr:histidine--tRNA ligase [Oscillospiraceae bacterium]
MAQQITAPRGTKDVLPGESYKWRYVEGKLADICRRFGYDEIRVPTFEHTELFARGVGDTTDIVGKEMYTFTDKGGRSVTLRPEGTAGTARSFLQNGILAGPLPARAYYILSCFRYEKPQAGRLREFHQCGIELYGAPGADADCEAIRVADTILRELQVKNVRLEINSIGCPECRPVYHAALRDYFKAHESELCDTCRERLEKNPLRILDCKSPVCQAVAKDAPLTLDYLCGDCAAHFEEVKHLCALAGIECAVNPRIVRGLDYYTRTVFEFVHEAAGAQGTVCGGGRYDGLVEMLGGPHIPAVGFGMGLERLVDVLEAEGFVFPPEPPVALFVCAADEAGRDKARALVFELQRRGVRAQYDLNARSVKAQLKYADKLGAAYTMTLGGTELAEGRAALRDMRDGSTATYDIDPAQLAAALSK